MKTIEEIYQEMLAVFDQETGMALSGAGEQAVRMYALAAQVYGLYEEAAWTKKQCFPQTATGEDLDRLVALFKEYYGEHCMDRTRPYDGIMPLLAVLKEEGYRMAIVSNKVDEAVKELAKQFFGEYVSVAIGNRADIRRKPAPDSVLQAMKELGASKEESVYVGDSEVDLATARAAGIPCVTVLWGFREKEFLVEQGAEIFADRPEEVPGIIMEME